MSVVVRSVTPTSRRVVQEIREPFVLLETLENIDLSVNYTKVKNISNR